MREFLCEPHHLWIAIAFLLLALLVLGGGKGIGSKLLSPLLKRLLNKKESPVTINIEGGEMPGEKNSELRGQSCPFDPANCRDHKAEHERSLRNIEAIKDLWGAIKALQEKLDTIHAEIGEVKGMLSVLIAKR